MNESSNDIVRLVSSAVSVQELEDLRQNLASHLDTLISGDFLALVRVLYRLDISEKKLKKILEETGGKNASFTIADMIIERQLQKIRSRAEHKKGNDNIPDDERW
jgi:hypothetical protein